MCIGDRKQIESNLKVGDRVVTRSGLVGRIVDLGERAKIEIAPGVTVQMLKTAIEGLDVPPEAKPAESASETEWPVSLGLATEEGFPHQGTVNFVDNQVNPKTGTLRVRGVFPNKEQRLSPGYFARVRVPVGLPHQALLVSDRALDNDQGQKVLYVVNKKDEVVSRAIQAGALHDRLRAIEDGLKPGERVIVNGLQQVRAGATVEPKLVEMPGRNPKSEARNVKEIQTSKSK